MSKQRKTLADCDVDEVYTWWASLTDDQRKLKTTAALMEGVFGVKPSAPSMQQYIARHKFRERLKRQVKSQEVQQKAKGSGKTQDANLSLDSLGTTIDLLENVNVQLNTMIDVVVKGVIRIANNKEFKASEATSLLATTGDVLQKTAEVRTMLYPLNKVKGADFGSAPGLGDNMNENSAEIYNLFQDKAKKT